MADIKLIRLAAIVLFSVLFTGGCQPVPDESDQEAFLEGIELQKFKLQRQMERQYTNPEIHYKLGKIYQSEGKWDKAISEFKLAKSFDPVGWDSAAGIVKTYYQDGKKEKALKAAQKYMKQASYSGGASLNLGKAFQDEGLDDEALTCYKQALSIAPGSAKLNAQIGHYYYEKNDLIRAEQYYRRSFDIKPTPEVAKGLGLLGIDVDLDKELPQTIKTDKNPESGEEK